MLLQQGLVIVLIKVKNAKKIATVHVHTVLQLVLAINQLQAQMQNLPKAQHVLAENLQEVAIRAQPKQMPNQT